MKLRFIILLSLCITAGAAKAQIRLDPFYPYSHWSVGAGVGFSTMYGNLNHSNSEPVYRINVQRNGNAWMYLNAEIQHGALSDYETKNHWTNGMNAYNEFSSIAITGRMSVGQLFNFPKNFFAKTLFGIYGGVGVGYMSNYLSSITQKFKHQDKYLITDYDSRNIKRRTTNAYIPFVLGWNIHLTKRCMFNVNYQFSYAFSDYLDGYNFQAPTATNNYNSMFSVLSFGLDFYVGKVGVVRDIHKKDKMKGKKK